MSRTRSSCALGLLLGLAVLSSPVLAGEGRPEVVVQIAVLKETAVKDAEGREQKKLEPVQQANPGDTLVYRITCTNKGDAPAESARIVDPIPAGTHLVPGSWSLAAAEFMVSADGGKSFGTFPIRRPVRLSSGEVIEKEVELSAYTHVRWNASQPLPPGESREAAFKVIVR